MRRAFAPATTDGVDLFGSVPREVFVAIAALALVWALAVSFGRLRARVRRQLRFERAREGEREAAAILERHGYVVEGAQVATSYDAIVDGVAVVIDLRADYLVTRGPKRFVAEVKTGKAAPRIETAATRRQLFEYRHAFAVDGVLLVDADRREVHVIELPERVREAGTPRVALALMAALVAVALVLALR